ncbi:pyridoxine 5'-phosphate synthase [Flavobacteriaceae bacterium TK19130]|nr:pyridoxine 5'-phosphate synthase [Thermobacterium salinum]
MTKLSVNINKIATLRNARGGDSPNVLQAAKDVQAFGAHGVTVHPRPDERHIRYSDVRDIQPCITTEFNVEGKPIDKFMELVLAVKPTQVTLVPDAENAITSDSGWDTVKHKDYLVDVIEEFKRNGIRTSIFVDPKLDMVEGAAETGTDRIELYTEAFAKQYAEGNEKAVIPYAECAKLAHQLDLGVNAGHDLSLQNIEYFKKNVPYLAEVSIGHALISEAIYHGLENVIHQYLEKLK